MTDEPGFTIVVHPTQSGLFRWAVVRTEGRCVEGTAEQLALAVWLAVQEVGDGV